MTDKFTHHNITISCSATVREILCEALKSYAQDVLPETDAGPYGATRHQLLNVIHHIEQKSLEEGDVLLIDQSYKGPCVAAIHHHYSRIHRTINASVDEQKQLMLDLLHGMPVCDSQLDAALQTDKML